MAFVDVTVPEPDPNEESATFVRFDAIGDKLAGIFLSKVDTDDSFNPGKKRTNYKFKTQNGTEICTPSKHLKQCFEAANGGKGLQRGNRVIATYTKDLALKGVGRDGTDKQPMKIFQLKVDSDPRPLAGPGAAARSQPKPPPKPEPKPQGDDEFGDFADVPY